ncbi:MAG: hypothetical protein KDC90_13375, partial [Ignavibacteriae bacterium]|nr:hypothetical protein [Ignavibacteriota bacterium]
MIKTNKKEFSSFQLITTLVALLAFGVFLLIASGLFDSADAVVQHVHTENNMNTQPQAPAADLSKINEINKLEEIVKNNPDNHEAVLNLGHMLNDN